MDRQTAIENLLDLYENPQHRGALADADITVRGGNPGCGDIVMIHLKVRDGEFAESIMFEGEGCTISQAAAEMVAERMEGSSLEAIEQLDHDIVIDELGREVVMTRPRCATLALGTLKQAVHDYRLSRRAAEADSREAMSRDTMGRE
jgi:nitrogen fixation NifU-like protein